MKVVMTLLVRDEEDIIDANIRFHQSQGVDHFIVTNNLSKDGTAGILDKYVREGSATVIDEESDDYSQSIWVTRMARMARQEFGADWVINSDADEFWWPLYGNLKMTLERLPNEATLVLVSRYNLPPLSTGEEPFWRRQVVREVVSLNPSGNPLPPKVCHRGASDIIVGQGNHSAFTSAFEIRACVCPLMIFHYPMRSYAQFENKIRLGGAAYERNTSLPYEVGHTWRQLYELYKLGRLRERYDQDVLSEAIVSQKIGTGEVVIDQRLANYLDRLGLS